MAHVVDYEEFNELKSLVLEMKEENNFLRSLVMGQRWLTRPQVLTALDVSENALWRLTKSDTLKNYKEGRKTFYDVDSVRSYLMSKKILKKAAENRIIKACYEHDSR